MSQPIQVLHVMPTLDHKSGGPSAALTGLAAAQRAAGAEVTVVIGRLDPDDTSMADGLRAAGVEVHDLSVHPASLDVGVDAADVVHIHAVWEGMLHRAAVRARKQGTPYVFRTCGMLAPHCLTARSGLKKRAYIALRLRRDLDHAAAIHFTTEAERDGVARLGFRAPVIVEPNGVDLDVFSSLPARGGFRAARGIDADRPMVLFMGRLHQIKGLDRLIWAFANVDHPSTLVLVGPDEGGYRAEVEKMIRDEGIVDRVVLTGMLSGDDRLAAFADADLFVLPSYHENFGVAAVEALASGLPVIVSDQVNIHTEITAAQVGDMAWADNAESLRDRLDNWIDDDDLRANAAKRARPFVANRYAWPAIANRWLQHYTSFLPQPLSP